MKKMKKGLKLATVQRIWHEINEAVFDNSLTEPVFRITRSLNYYGMCVRREADAGRRLSIYISGPMHRGDSVALRDTLAHEMVHQWQYENGLKYNEHDETFTQWLPKIKEKLGIEIVDTWSFDSG